jgi:hypothetical protein
MKFLKLVLIGIVVVFLAFVGMRVLGVAFQIMFNLFWLALIGLVALGLWKMFGPKSSRQVEEAEPASKLQTPEMTLDEYKRKLEAQMRNKSER